MSFWYYSLPILLKDLFDSESVFGKAVWLWVKSDTKRSPNRWRDQTKCMILDVLLTEYMEWKYFPTESYKCEMQHNACLLFPLISPVLQSILCLCFNPSQTNVFVNYKQVFWDSDFFFPSPPQINIMLLLFHLQSFVKMVTSSDLLWL